MAQTDKNSISLSKTQTHIMLTQLNIKGRLKVYGVKFIMHEYIEKLLEELPSDMQGLATTPDPGCKKISEE